MQKERKRSTKFSQRRFNEQKEKTLERYSDAIPSDYELVARRIDEKIANLEWELAGGEI